MGWAGIGWDGMGWDGIGWDGMGLEGWEEHNNGGCVRVDPGGRFGE